jgi:hypothetical protein
MAEPNPLRPLRYMDRAHLEALASGLAGPSGPVDPPDNMGLRVSAAKAEAGLPI